MPIQRDLARAAGATRPAAVLLTATITPPPGVPALLRTDPAERLEDYRLALDFYLDIADEYVDRIVFAENSASDLTVLESLVAQRGGNKDVELLSFFGLDYPVEHGRGVGETRLIDTALTRSRVLRELDERELFWKITGRLQIRNLARLVETAPANAMLYADFRRLPRPWVDTRVFACTRAAFRSLFSPRMNRMRHDELAAAGYTAPEQWLFGELLAERASGNLVPRLRVEPTIRGYSGHGGDYGRPSRRLWCAARATSRRLAPGLWI